jgi:hypothetical protein
VLRPAERVLETGAAFGYMMANLTRWSHKDARVVSLDLVHGTPSAVPGAPERQVEVPAQDHCKRRCTRGMIGLIRILRKRVNVIPET